MRKRSYNTNQAFLDLIFNALLAFVGLFCVAMAMINVEKKSKLVDAKAEFIVTVTWNKDLDCDVDTYMENPNGDVVCFNRKTCGLMHLDRDDVGVQGDFLRTKNGTVKFDENIEVASVRGIVPGEYIVNVHAYSFHRIDQGNEVEVTIKLEKINPYSIVAFEKVVLVNTGDEKTALRFKVNVDGEVVDLNRLQKKLVSSSRSES